ncbi:MAG: LysR family transcriptional regulator [Rhodospirillaceae bacterium]
MTLEQLRIFVAVAQRQHFTQAAHNLRLPPSFSHRSICSRSASANCL